MTKRTPLQFFGLLPLGLGYLVLSLALGCAQKGVQGVWFSPSQIAQLKVGEQTQEEVIAILGVPNLVNPYRPHIAYYYGSLTKQVGRFSPHLRDRQVLILLFSPKSLVLQALEVRNIDKVTLARSSSAKTKGLRSAKRNLLKDIFGNIGQVGVGEAP